MKEREKWQKGGAKKSVYFASSNLQKATGSTTFLVDVANSRHNLFLKTMPFHTKGKRGNELKVTKYF